MTNFNKHYIRLLKDQVNVEIMYLQSQGHTRDSISSPCIFCFQDRHGEYKCNRLNDLRNFQSQLIVREKTSYMSDEQPDYSTSKLYDEVRALQDDGAVKLLPPSEVKF